MPITVPDRFHNVSLAGNTAGALAEISSGTLTIAGGNNITVSQAGNAVTISGAAAGGAQTGISGLANSETTYTSGSVTLSALGAITIRSTTGQHFQFSVNAQTVESNTIGMSNIGNTSGDTAIRSGPQLQIVLAGGNNITLSQSTNGSSATITVSAFTQSAESNTIGMSNIGNTAGDTAIRSANQLRIVFAGGNNITLSQSTNGSSATITVSAFNQTVESNTIGMSNIGNTSGDTAIRSAAQLQIVLAGGNNVTLSQSTNGSSATITISAFNQTVESNTIGMSNIGNTSGDTAIRSGPQLRIVLAGGNNITLSQSTNGSSATVTISAFNQTSPVVSNAIQSVSSATNSGTNTSRFAADDHVHAGVGPAGVSNIGNTSGDTTVMHGRLVFAGGNNITLSVSSSNNNNQTITISAAAGGGAGYTAGLSNLGNTSGDTGVVTGRLVLVGSNNITMSGSTNGGSMTITVSGANELSAGLSNIGNTSGDTTLASERLVLAGGDNITLSGSSNGGSLTVTVSQRNYEVGWVEYPPGNFRHPFGTVGTNFYIWPVHFSNYMIAHSVAVMISGSGASGSTAGATIPIGIYTNQTGASSSRLSLLASAQMAVTWTSGTNADGNWGGIFGHRRWATAMDVTITPGQYWIGICLSTTNAGTLSFFGAGSNQLLSGIVGVSNTTRQLIPFLGVQGGTATAPNSILSNAVTGQAQNFRVQPWIMFMNTTSYNWGA